ncbi:hypothetical protein DLREEDagrD3_24710 [Denitratisoma sp. agr-D3]
MHPTHDVDVVILMATTLCSKRRPARLDEIVAAADMIQGFIPYESKLHGAFIRLSTHGLICAAGDGYTLTPAAQTLLASLPRKGSTEEHIALLKEKVVAYYPYRQQEAIELTAAQITDALVAHKAVKKTPGDNMLMPKAEADRYFKVDGRWRKAPAKGTRKH